MQCVLVVDKCRDSILTLQILLQSGGYESWVAVDGPTALDLADSFWPDVAVLDICLPGMDGYELGKRLRKPFIVVHSGCCTAGFIAHLPKPVDPENIRKILEICEKWLNSLAQGEDKSSPTASLLTMTNAEA